MSLSYHDKSNGLATGLYRAAQISLRERGFLSNSLKRTRNNVWVQQLVSTARIAILKIIVRLVESLCGCAEGAVLRRLDKVESILFGVGLQRFHMCTDSRRRPPSIVRHSFWLTDYIKCDIWATIMEPVEGAVRLP